MDEQEDPLQLSRREFLQRLGVGAGAASGAALLTELEASAGPRKRLQVVIVGAGLAGLCAAYELEQRGHTAILLEAEESYIGGRVRTLRFGDGLYGEAGAMRIPASHSLTRHYVKQFGLGLRPFVESNPEAYYYVHGQRRRLKQVAHLDHRYTQGMEGQAGSVWAQQFHELVGGMDSLPNAFAARLRAKPRLGCAVIRLEQDSVTRRAAAIYRERGKNASAGTSPQRVEGDFVLCTLPLPVLRHIETAPAFSAVKRRAIHDLPYMAAHKVLAATTRRFWEADDHIFGGGTFTDLPTGLTYYPSDNATAKDPHVSARPGVLLASYTIGKPARHLATLTRADCSASTMRYLARVHPQLSHAGIMRKAESWSWDNHPWSGGGFASPGQRADLRATLLAPEGRIFLAGEHASHYRTWMQGALETALYAVREMLAIRHV